jgi:hypothetical protein
MDQYERRAYQNSIMVKKMKYRLESEKSESITSQLIQWQSVQKWDGKLPYVVGNDNAIMIPMGKGMDDL